MGDENARKIDFRLTVGVQEFDEIFKDATISFDIDEKDKKSQEPFLIYARIYPFSGATIHLSISKK